MLFHTMTIYYPVGGFMKSAKTEYSSGMVDTPGPDGKEQPRRGRAQPGIRSTIDCIPCFIRQAIDSVRFSTPDSGTREQIVREALLTIAGMEMGDSPPVIAQHIHRRLRQLSRVDDPYRAVKDRFNRMALDMLPALESRVRGASDPLDAATRLAIAGNVIDLGAKADLQDHDARAAVAGCMDVPLHGDLEAFRRTIGKAREILYLADNAGEIVFDRLLIEQLSPGRVTLAVRGAAVINDATVHDARQAGLYELVEVIDNGSDAPGTVLTDCSREFRESFGKADLIIAKGQGNFETLFNAEAPVFFLFKVKCGVIASHVGLPVGTHVLEHFGAARAESDGDSGND